MRVIFFGTPAFAARQLSELLKQGVNVVAVVTKPDRPQGRSRQPIPSAVKQVALSHCPSLPLFQPESVSTSESAEFLKKSDADLFVVIAYGEILKENLLQMPKVACINLHASLLPKYRGAAPIQRSLLAGENESGVTLMHMVKKMDAGDIISQAIVPITPNMTYGELEEKLGNASVPLLLKTIQQLEKGTAERTPQNHFVATYAPKIELEECQIDWKHSADQIHNLVRGVNPEPGAWCFVQTHGSKKRLRVYKTEIVPDRQQTPGEILEINKVGFIVACGQQAVLIKELQLEGKKTMGAQEFIRGFSLNSIKFVV